MSEKNKDVVRTLLAQLLQSELPYEKKMEMLDALEPVIEKSYASGLTQVKPVRLMTADDIDPDVP